MARPRRRNINWKWQPKPSRFRASATFAPMSARRMLVFGGIALIAIGMIFGDIFAVFILHQNAGEQGAALSSGGASGRRQKSCRCK